MIINKLKERIAKGEEADDIKNDENVGQRTDSDEDEKDQEMQEWNCYYILMWCSAIKL